MNWKTVTFRVTPLCSKRVDGLGASEFADLLVLASDLNEVGALERIVEVREEDFRNVRESSARFR